MQRLIFTRRRNPWRYIIPALIGALLLAAVRWF